MNIENSIIFNVLKRTPTTLFSWVKHYSFKFPDQIAFQSIGRPPMNYRELYQTLQYARKNLAYAGIEPQDHVALWLDSSPEYALISIALSDGAVCVPFSKQTTLHEAKKLFESIGIKALIIDEELSAPIVQLAFELGIKTIVIEAQLEKPCGSFNITSTMNGQLKRWPHIKNTNTAFIFQTTGSTSKPKIVPIRMESVVIASKAMSDALQLNKNDTCLNFLPLNFIHGLVTSVYVPLISGGTVVFPGQFEGNFFLRWIEEYKPTWFSATPAIYSAICKLPEEEFQKALHKNKLRFIRVGSAPLSRELMHSVENLFKVPLIEAYGMTETLLISCNPIIGRKLGSVGKVVSSSQVKILNEKGEFCKPLEMGSIWVKGKTITKGYIDNSDANSEAFKNDCFQTGDLGFLDNDGFLYLAGRTKDMVNKGGQKISLKEVEEILLKYDGIKEAVGFSIPHPTLGEDLAVAVTLEQGYAYHENELKRHLLKYLSPYKIPQKIIFLTDFPLSENGKVLRSKLLEIYQNEATSLINKDVEMNTEQKYVHGYFATVLKKEFIGVDEDFFSLGGTSLDVAVLTSAISDELGEDIRGIALIANSTIKDFAIYLTLYFKDSLLRVLQVNTIASPIEKTETISLFKKIIEQQKKLFKSWTGERKSEESLIVGQNTSGTKRPVFWCFHSATDIDRLAQHLGEDQPVYGMRSGYLLFRMDEKLISELGIYYAREIFSSYPDGPYIIGGSCQGGHIAWYIVQELRSLGCSVELLCLLDATIKKNYNGKVALFYGEDDPHYNPFKNDTSFDWLSMYKESSVDFLKVEHGKFFTKENVAELAEKLSNRLAQLRS